MTRRLGCRIWADVAGGWLDITDRSGASGPRREVLQKGLTRFGGGDADVRLAASGDDQLHFWDEPPRVVFIGGGAPPLLRAQPVEEAALRPGDRIEWGNFILEYGGEAAPADLSELEEIHDAVPSAETAVAKGGHLSEADERIWRRLLAGLVVEMQMVDKKIVKRWQQAVVDGGFNADRCAEEIVSSAQRDDLRLAERSSRLLRDFLMASLLRGARGAGRRARQAARGGVAFLLAQATALIIYSLIVIAAAILMYIKGFSFDELFDRILMRN